PGSSSRSDGRSAGAEVHDGLVAVGEPVERTAATRVTGQLGPGQARAARVDEVRLWVHQGDAPARLLAPPELKRPRVVVGRNDLEAGPTGQRGESRTRGDPHVPRRVELDPVGAVLTPGL